MESQYSAPRMTLTNLLIGAPPATSSSSCLPDTNQRMDNADDIYRGSDPRSPAPNSGHHLAFSPTTRPESGSSSSSSSGVGFNIIPSVIEHAITRWARGRGLRRRGSSSSGSSSTSSSSSSSSAASGQGKRRKKSPASLLSRTTSITTRRQARAMSRAAPREFILFLPKHLSLSVPRSTPGVEIGDYASRRELRTTSLKLVLAQLGAALKQNAKSNRPPRQPIPHHDARDPSRVPEMTTLDFAENGHHARDGPHIAFNIPTYVDPSIPKILGKGKGKPREVPRQFFLQEKESSAPERQPCWWLDIATPTWDDMRALGKLLQLHPLTLEDILQKESREKFELFPRLGYYFVIFRAVERPQPDSNLHDDDASFTLDDGAAELTEVLDIANVYLVVFKEGICTFHFEDISLHMDSVRRKVLQLEGTIPMGSDWIAHGLMDSIVDAFFPLLKDIQKEVLLVEDFVSGLDDGDRDDDKTNPVDPSASKVEIVVANGGPLVTAEKEMREKNEKSEHDTASKDTRKSEKGLPLGTQLIEWAKMVWYRKRQNSTLVRDVNRLRRMTITRRLVTTLGRLLSAKLEVLAQIRKRLDGQGEVAIYLGDVQDHIISLNQSLIHYERMLSHSHPTYVTHLRFSLSEAKGGLDRALVVLTLVSLLVLCNQVISSLCSLNLNIPRSDDFKNFGLVVAVALAVSVLLFAVVRFWHVKARGKLWIKMPRRN